MIKQIKTLYDLFEEKNEKKLSLIKKIDLNKNKNYFKRANYNFQQKKNIWLKYKYKTEKKISLEIEKTIIMVNII